MKHNKKLSYTTPGTYIVEVIYECPVTKLARKGKQVIEILSHPTHGYVIYHNVPFKFDMDSSSTFGGYMFDKNKSWKYMHYFDFRGADFKYYKLLEKI